MNNSSFLSRNYRSFLIKFTNEYISINYYKTQQSLPSKLFIVLIFAVSKPELFLIMPGVKKFPALIIPLYILLCLSLYAVSLHIGAGRTGQDTEQLSEKHHHNAWGESSNAIKIEKVQPEENSEALSTAVLHVFAPPVAEIIRVHYLLHKLYVPPGVSTPPPRKPVLLIS